MLLLKVAEEDALLEGTGSHGNELGLRARRVAGRKPFGVSALFSLATAVRSPRLGPEPVGPLRRGRSQLAGTMECVKRGSATGAVDPEHGYGEPLGVDREHEVVIPST
jgi:hypothetical protein